jgi:hypothetical protein
MGSAANGVSIDAGGGFVDLERAVGLPETVHDACAVAESEYSAATPGTRMLAIASDDEVRVSVNGKDVYARSPLRTPRAGVPGGPPLPLDQLESALADTAEREVAVPLLQGANKIVVTACRVGEDFGFFVGLK